MFEVNIVWVCVRSQDFVIVKIVMASVYIYLCGKSVRVCVWGGGGVNVFVFFLVLFFTFFSLGDGGGGGGGGYL